MQREHNSKKTPVLLRAWTHLFVRPARGVPACCTVFVSLPRRHSADTRIRNKQRNKWSPGAVPTFSDPCNHPARFLSYSSKMEPKQQRDSLEMRLSSHESITRVAFTCTQLTSGSMWGHGYMDGRFVVLTHRPIKVRRSWFHARWCD